MRYWQWTLITEATIGGIKLQTVLNTTQLGIATIRAQSDVDSNSSAVNEGFYAVAYDVQGAGTIIAYRGTALSGKGHLPVMA